MKLIRKISIGSDYKNKAMHFSLGQLVFGEHKIESIDEINDGSFEITISKLDEVMPWKKINPAMPVIVEYVLDY